MVVSLAAGKSLLWNGHIAEKNWRKTTQGGARSGKKRLHWLRTTVFISKTGTVVL